MSAASQEQPSPEDRGRTPGLRIATIGGVPVYIGRTWPIIALVVVVTFGPQVQRARPDLGVTSYVVAATFAILLLVSVLAHEGAHAVVATRTGYRVSRVVADLWGGHTAFDSVGARPGTSALVAVAGPAANGALAFVGWLLTPLIPGGVPSMLAGALVYTNAFVALFNMLPGLPLDGGYLVDALVWRITGSRERGLIAAGWSGRVVAALVVAWFVGLPLTRGQSPTLVGIVWGGLIGAFLWAGAGNAIRAGRAGRLLSGIRVESVWRRATTLPTRASAADAVGLRGSGLGGSGLGGSAIVVVDDAGTPVGLVDDAALGGIPEPALHHTPVTAAMHLQPPGWVLDTTADQPITQVVVVMQSLGIRAVPIRLPSGEIVGIVHAGDLEAALSRPRSART